MKTHVALSLDPLPTARSAGPKVAEMAIDDVTMRERLTEYLYAETGGPVEVEAFQRRSPGFSWTVSPRAIRPATAAN